MTETTDWSREDWMSEQDDYGIHVGSHSILFKLNLVVPNAPGSCLRIEFV